MPSAQFDANLSPTHCYSIRSPHPQHNNTHNHQHDTPTQSPTHWSSSSTVKPTHQQCIDATMFMWHSEAIAEVAQLLHRQFKTLSYTSASMVMVMVFMIGVYHDGDTTTTTVCPRRCSRHRNRDGGRRGIWVEVLVVYILALIREWKAIKNKHSTINNQM